MASLKTIRQALAAQISTIDGLVVYATVPDAANMPACVVEPDQPGINYLQTFKSQKVIWNLALIVLAGRVNEGAAQDLIDDYISPDGDKSIPGKIESDQTLGGVVDYCVATQLSRYGRFEIGDLHYLGAQIDLEVRA